MLLLIDNIDSFTHNLGRYFVELGEDVCVLRNDELSLAQIEQIAPTAIVVSPGPCTPIQAGISLDAIASFAGKIPILGVCLGHQAIGEVFGAKLVGAKEIMHGKVCKIHHDNDDVLFAGLPCQFNVTRYHSLVLELETLPAQLACSAWCTTEEGETEIMAIRHRKLPIWGVQFHPESLLTEYGHQLLDNFLQQTTPRTP